MTNTSKLAALCGAVGLALIAITGTAAADGYEVAAPAAADEGRKFTYPFNISATSDCVFRGISQTDNDPTIQGGIDLGYGIQYAGWWASGLDFEAGLNDAQVEMDAKKAAGYFTTTKPIADLTKPKGRGLDE